MPVQKMRAEKENANRAVVCINKFYKIGADRAFRWS